MQTWPGALGLRPRRRFEAHHSFREETCRETGFGFACARGELGELIYHPRFDVEPVELFDDWRFFLH